MSLSLKSGGAASPGIGRLFFGSPSFSRFDMSFVLQRFWRENASEWRPAQDSGSRISKMLECIRRNGDDYVVWGEVSARLEEPQRVPKIRVVLSAQWMGESQ
jgi:hypothetical protein